MPLINNHIDAAFKNSDYAEELIGNILLSISKASQSQKITGVSSFFDSVVLIKKIEINFLLVFKKVMRDTFIHRRIRLIKRLVNLISLFRPAFVAEYYRDQNLYESLTLVQGGMYLHMCSELVKMDSKLVLDTPFYLSRIHSEGLNIRFERYVHAIFGYDTSIINDIRNDMEEICFSRSDVWALRKNNSLSEEGCKCNFLSNKWYWRFFSFRLCVQLWSNSALPSVFSPVFYVRLPPYYSPSIKIGNFFFCFMRGNQIAKDPLVVIKPDWNIVTMDCSFCHCMAHCVRIFTESVTFPCGVHLCQKCSRGVYLFMMRQKHCDDQVMVRPSWCSPMMMLTVFKSSLCIGDSLIDGYNYQLLFTFPHSTYEIICTDSFRQAFLMCITDAALGSDTDHRHFPISMDVRSLTRHFQLKLRLPQDLTLAQINSVNKKIKTKLLDYETDYD